MREHASIRERINAWLDSLPCAQVLRGAASLPAYRACGIAGFYAALVVTAAAGLVTGRSLLALAVLSFVCAGSFFAYTYGRRWITGVECLVLIEHVWFALAASAAALYLMGEPVLVYLDLAIPGLCLFLAGGRAGCLVAGCCHGCPSSVGISYPRKLVAEGFPAHWVGVRLLPVQIIELLALIGIGATAFAWLPWAPAGQVLAWYLAAYSIVRFGLEQLRGDRRPQWLGLSQARWMSLIELSAVIWWQNRPSAAGESRVVWIAGGVVAALVVVVLFRYFRSLRRGMLEPRHVAEVRSTVFALQPGDEPAFAATSRGLAVAVSASGHVSMSLPGLRRDLWLLCELAAFSFPEIHASSARYFNGVLHVVVGPDSRPDRVPASTHAEVIWAYAAGDLGKSESVPSKPAPPATENPAWYFRAGAKG